jgi:hypothetical protein
MQINIVLNLSTMVTLMFTSVCQGWLVNIASFTPFTLKSESCSSYDVGIALFTVAFTSFTLKLFLRCYYCLRYTLPLFYYITDSIMFCYIIDSILYPSLPTSPLLL